MRRTLRILVLVAMVCLLHAAEARAGAGALDTYASFSGPAFSTTVVLNADAVNITGPVPNGTVAIRVTRASTSSAVLFDSGYVSK